ncbi:hypothetical protein [Pontibacter sp. G13]|uniref:hypothetical protein n=1 Tax=Pontibacter sp. G13 TaxID=3074898 RepID=UPI0028895D64|nr:hypothetical protein [Pontibacter sp. G13]WNJ21242.1 hypothetical protein RJD25_12305 [Pontibacter sp. G13]
MRIFTPVIMIMALTFTIWGCQQTMIQPTTQATSQPVKPISFKSQLLDDFIASESCSESPEDDFEFTLNIRAISDADHLVEIDNVFFDGWKIQGTIIGNQVVFDEARVQTRQGEEDAFVSGIATLSTDGELIFDYNLTDATGSHACTLVGARG